MKNSPRVNVLLSLDDTKNFVDLFVILIAVDRRVNAVNKPKAKKSTKAKTKRKDIGSQPRALFFYSTCITLEILESSSDNSGSKNTTNDRHHSFYFNQRQVPDYSS